MARRTGAASSLKNKFCGLELIVTFAMVQSFIHNILKTVTNMATKEKSVRATINGLAVGAKASFPLAQYDYVVSCRTRLQLTSGKQFSSTINRKRDVVVITRTEDKPE